MTKDTSGVTEQEQREEYDLTAGVFYVVGGLLLVGGFLLAVGFFTFGGALALSAGKAMKVLAWPLWIALSMAGLGAGSIAMGVAVTRHLPQVEFLVGWSVEVMMCFMLGVLGLAASAVLGVGMLAAALLGLGAAVDIPAIFSLAALGFGLACIGLGVMVTKRWRYTGLVVLAVLVPFVFYTRSGGFLLILVCIQLWRVRATYLPFGPAKKD